MTITVAEAIETLKQGKMIIIVDDEQRENEGDLMIAAEKVTPENINFMAKEARGLICVSLTEKRSAELDLPLMVNDNTSHFQTPFTVSVDAKRNTTTGISAFDRAETIKCLIDPQAQPHDLSRPGHIFPLRARDGGVLVRTGQTEASVDLARIAGLCPAGVICEIMKEDGTMARMPDLERVLQKTLRADHHRRGDRQVPRADRLPGGDGLRGPPADALGRLHHQGLRRSHPAGDAHRPDPGRPGRRRSRSWCASIRNA